MMCFYFLIARPPQCREAFWWIICGFCSGWEDPGMKVAKTLVSALFASLFVAAMTFGQAAAQQQQQRPNIVVIWGDDIGQSNVSAYSRGMMGYQTPNIDRVASEGVLF